MNINQFRVQRDHYLEIKSVERASVSQIDELKSLLDPTWSKRKNSEDLRLKLLEVLHSKTETSIAELVVDKLLELSKFETQAEVLLVVNSYDLRVGSDILKQLLSLLKVQ